MHDSLLIDLNVMLDVLLERAPHVTTSANVFELIAENKVQGCLSGASIDTMAYLLSPHHTSARINGILRFVRLKFEITPVTQAIIDEALAADWADLEDAIVYHSAKSYGCAAIITRNVKDFRKKDSTDPMVLTPTEYLTSRRSS